MEELGNYLHLSGVISQSPTYGHEVFGEKVCYATLSVPRLSGAEDLLPITLSERLMEGVPLELGAPLTIEGQLRSYNKVIEGAGRLLITAFVQRILPPDSEENPNQVQLQGALCKPPSYRTTPFGREIADLMLAVNRAYGKSDYIPCITWGRTARFACATCMWGIRCSSWAVSRAAPIKSSWRTARWSAKWPMRSLWAA